MDQLKSNIAEIDIKINILRKRMDDLRSQMLVLETELIGYKISRVKMSEELKRKILSMKIE